MRVALLASMLIGCTDEVEVRACNDSGFAVTDLEYGAQRVDMLANGECSSYVIVERSGSSPPTNLVIDDEVYVHSTDRSDELPERRSLELSSDSPARARRQREHRPRRGPRGLSFAR